MEKKDLDFLNAQTKNEFSEVNINVSSKSEENNENVVNAIKDFAPIDGWISLQSSSAKRIQNTDFEVGNEHVLAGEFYNLNGVSLSVRFNGDHWTLITYYESEGGELVLKRNVRQLSKINDKTYLNYDVFYKFDSELGYRPYCSAFTGFSEGK
ncbi:MAG: hypothetical protein K5930_01335 [Treponemataceae bacterium]|nr:hypothetical protein [Treponemataceae bacterium]